LKKVSSGILLTFLVVYAILSGINIQPAKAEGTIYIKADGSINPSIAPILRNGDTYVFTDSTYYSIIVERDNILIDGAGYVIRGQGSECGIDLSYRVNVTVRGLMIEAFYYGIGLWYSYNNTVSENNIVNNFNGIRIKHYSQGNIITENNFGNNTCGIWTWWSSDNKIYHNSFIDNAQQAWVNEPGYSNTWDDGYASGGNYWNDYSGADLNADGIGDIPYFIEADNVDNYPLMTPPQAVYFPLNHHYYQAVSVQGNVTWADAKSQAESLSFFGRNGHLATVTSQAENDFIINNLGGPIELNRYWLGGFQPTGSPEPDGNWQWVTGEPWNYTNWAPGEPTNCYGGEWGGAPLGSDEEVLQLWGYSGWWNDMEETSYHPGFIVEYEGNWTGHDITVTNMNVAPCCGLQGFLAYLNVTASNVGGFNETFNLSVYADTVEIGTENVNLSKGNSTIVIYRWNTTEVICGRYTIWAKASVVPGEKDTADNTLIDGTVVVKPNFHDVTITSVRLSCNFAYVGDDITIYTDVWNRGEFPETFNVTVYADDDTNTIGDEITVGTQSLLLDSKASATLISAWNTTSVPAGTYTISAIASQVSREADLSDNLLVDGTVELFSSVPCQDIEITCPSTLTVNPAIFTYDEYYRARLIGIGNVTIKSTGFEGALRIVGSRNDSIHLCVNEPNVDVYIFAVPKYGEVQIPLWLMFQPETHWEEYNGNFTLQLTVCGTHRKQLKIVGISINVCENGAYIVYNETVTFTWNLTGGSFVYLEAEANLPPGWSYTVDPPIGTLFETPHMIRVNITAPSDAEEGEMGSVTLKAYKNATDTMIWQFVYFATTDNNPPSIEEIEQPVLTPTGDLMFGTTVTDLSGIQGVELYYSINGGSWNNVSMQWSSGDTFDSTVYTAQIPHMADGTVIDYYVVATDWLKNQTQSDIQTIIAHYDLEVSEVNASKSVIAQGYLDQITISIANQGTTPISYFKVVVYLDTTVINTYKIPYLENGEITTLTFNLNTTIIAKGNHIIAVYAIPIMSETDTSNNVNDGGKITISISGDVNGDFKVDGKDVAVVAKAYNTKPGDLLWNPNGDDKVDGKDIAIVAKYYNTHYP
jgi:parallel beta-helix repeat protein